MLALNANSTLSGDELIDGLWGERPPGERRQEPPALRLPAAQGARRRPCGGGDRHPRARLRAAPARGRGRRPALRAPGRGGRARAGERRGANGAASAALELWRGAPLADVASEPFAGPEIGRLEELHLRAIELAIDAELAAGRHADVIARLEELIAEEPLRERLHAQRMLALYRAGRQSEALEAYREARETLIEQIGVEPGPELQRLQAAVLAQDPSLDAPPPVAELPVQLEGGSPLLAGRERELDWLRRRWARGARRAGRLRHGLGAAGDRQDAARGRARKRGPARGAAVLYAGRRRGRRGRPCDRRRGRHGPPPDAARARLRRRRAAGGARGRGGARPRRPRAGRF